MTRQPNETQAQYNARRQAAEIALNSWKDQNRVTQAERDTLKADLQAHLNNQIAFVHACKKVGLSYIEAEKMIKDPNYLPVKE